MSQLGQKVDPACVRIVLMIRQYIRLNAGRLCVLKDSPESTRARSSDLADDSVHSGMVLPWRFCFQKIPVFSPPYL